MYFGFLVIISLPYLLEDLSFRRDFPRQQQELLCIGYSSLEPSEQFCRPVRHQQKKPKYTTMANMDFDTIEAGTLDTRLRLSVSEEPYAPSGLKVPLDLYVEHFDLKSILSTKVASQTRFGLFTSELRVPQDTKPIGLRVSGENGEYVSPKEARKDGGKGGLIEVYVESLPMSTAKRLCLEGW